MDSSQAVQILHERLTDQVVVASLGSPAFFLSAAGDRPLNFYMWAAMGMASSVGLGVAITHPDRRVVILDGDGAALMNLGGMVTVGLRAPKNLLWIILQNGVFLETGQQPIGTGRGTDLLTIARGAGLPNAWAADNPDDLGSVLDRGLREPGPSLVVARVGTDSPTGRPRVDAVLLKHRFMDALAAPKA